MTRERFSNYQFELSGEQLRDSGKWAPYLEIRDYSEDEEIGEVIFPRQRIGEAEVFESEDAAVAEARRFAISHVSSGEF